VNVLYRRDDIYESPALHPLFTLQSVEKLDESGRGVVREVKPGPDFTLFPSIRQAVAESVTRTSYTEAESDTDTF
jgi:hypothetical protein